MTYKIKLVRKRKLTQHIKYTPYMNRQLKFSGGSVIKNLPAKQKMQVQSLWWEKPLEKEMAAHSSTLVWKIPWTEVPGRL